MGVSARAGQTGPPGPAGADGLASRVLPVAFDPYVDLATGDGQQYFWIPADMDGWALTGAEAALTTVGTVQGTIVQVRNVTDTADMLSTRITVDTSEDHSKDAGTQPVINVSNRTVSHGDKLAIDIDQVGTGARGLQVYLTFEDPDSPLPSSSNTHVDLVERTTTLTVSSGTTELEVVTSNSFVADGVSQYLIEFYSPLVTGFTGNTLQIHLRENPAGANTYRGLIAQVIETPQTSCYGARVLTPTAGATVYRVTASRLSGGGNPVVVGDTGSGSVGTHAPIFIRITKLNP